MNQRIREAERERKYEEYASREGDIVTGIIQQTDSRYTLLDLGRVEALLPQAEQVPYERPEPGARLKAYIVEVRKTAKGPQIVVSRTHPGLIKRLFELEVPEIADGVVEIKACAREPGHRTKIAVWSNDHNVDPVGACVGARGARVRMVVNELRGEKIDIVPFTEDLADFVAKALSPAKVKEVRIHEDTGTGRGHRARLPAVAWPSARRARTPASPPASPAGASTSRARPSWPRRRPTPTRTGPRASGSPTPRPASMEWHAGRRRASMTRRAVEARPPVDERRRPRPSPRPSPTEADRRGGRSTRRVAEAVADEPSRRPCDEASRSRSRSRTRVEAGVERRSDRRGRIAADALDADGSSRVGRRRGRGCAGCAPAAPTLPRRRRSTAQRSRRA